MVVDIHQYQRLAPALAGLQLTLLSLTTCGTPAVADVVPDQTLPLNGRSQVSQGPLFQITGGTVNDRNLFHSFAQFSLGPGETAFFNNSTAVTNIIARVTGGRSSTIEGAIRANGKANLFLINPNGILFGPNASLNIGGSFLATTANAIQFANQGTFSATEPTEPPLLTVNPSSLLFNQLTPQPITNFGSLQVAAGQRLTLVGGNIFLDQGKLLAPGGQVALTGLAGKGQVDLGNMNRDQLTVNPDSPLALADITLMRGAEVNVRSGGSIAVQARNLTLLDGSILRGGIARGEGAIGTKAGNIDINATGAVTLTNSSFIANSTLGTGDSGDVNINAASVLLQDGSQINASTFGKGNSGTVTLRSQGRVTFDGESATGVSGGAYSRVNPGAVGNSGGINIFADSLFVQNGALLTASTLGQGNAGSVTIVTPGAVVFDGVGPVDQYPSGAYSRVGEPPFANQPGRSGNGSSGGLYIQAGSLAINNGAQLDASTSSSSRGNAGNIQIQVASAINLGGDPKGQFADPGGIYSFVGDGSLGAGGSIALSAQSLTMKGGSALVASTFGQGNAGNVTLQVAGPVLLDGQNPTFSTGIFSSVSRIAKGNSGQISLSVGSLTVLNGAAIAASTLGVGNAASVSVAAKDDVSFDGVGIDKFPSGIFSRVGTRAQGSSDITLTARSLSLTNGAQFQANTIGPANAGTIQVFTTDGVAISGINAATGLRSGLLSTTTASGNGGDINVNARSLNLRTSGIISAQSQGTGRAGNIGLHLRDQFQARDSQVSTTAAQSAGGNIAITARTIALLGDNDITTSVFRGEGGGGNISLTAKAIVLLGDSDILAFSRDGSGGNIALNTPAFFAFRYRSSPAADPATLDTNGRVDINASGRLSSGVISLPDFTVQQSRLAELPSEVIDTSRLIANSCIVRTARQGGSPQGRFIVTGAGGLPPLPDDPLATPFATYALVPEPASKTNGGSMLGRTALLPTQYEHTLVESDGIYRLNNGELVLGRSCQ